jgi:dolichyl-phosphate beta-glucosyltransferase
VTLAPSVSVIIPCFNEADRLTDTLASIREFTTRTTVFGADDLEWIFVDDGSSDGTLDLLEAYATGARHTRVVALPMNQGKGAAVLAGDAVARAPIRAFTDCDLATPLSALEEIPCLFRDYGADLVIGSRHTPWSSLVRPQPWARRVAGRLFSFVMAHFHRSAFTDTQCGFKAWHEEFARSVVQRLEERGWSFDLEMIGRAEQLQLTMLELPISWTDREGSKVRAAIDGPRMLFQGIKYWLKFTPRVMMGLGLVTAIVCVFQAMDWPIDVVVYHEAWTKTALRQLEGIYTPERTLAGGYYYSPLFAVLGVPFSFMSMTAARVGYALMEFILLGATLILLKRWTRDRLGRTSLGIAFWLTFYLAFLNTVFGQFQQGNLSLPIFYLCLLSGYSYLFNHRVLSAFWLSLAINIKIFPVFLLGLAILRRDWRFLGYASAFLLLSVLVPALYFGWDANWELHREWLTVLSEYGPENDPGRVQYQSLPSALFRVASHFGADPHLAVRAAQFLVVAAATAVWWKFRLRLSTEWIVLYSFFLAFTAQFLPYSWIPSMGFFYAPLVLVTMQGWAADRRWPYAIYLVIFLLMYSLSTEAFLGRELNDTIEYWSIPTIGIWVFLFAAYRYWIPRSEASPDPSSHFPRLAHFTPRRLTSGTARS